MLARVFQPRSGYWLVGWLVSLLLAACGDDATRSVAVSPVVATTAAVTPTALPPTLAPTTLAAPSVLPPTNTAAALPSPTVGAASTVLAQALTPTARPVGFPTVPKETIAANANAALTAQAQFSPIAGPTSSGTSIFGPTATPSAASTGAVLGGNLIYFLNDTTLKVVRSDGSGLASLANNVVRFRALGNNNLVYLQESSPGSLQLKYRKDNQESVLDPQVFAIFPGAATQKTLSFGTDSRVLIDSMALSPDGRQLAYIKANLNVIFDALLGKEHPTELWLVNLDLQNPAPRVLAPNDKDYIFRPVWSADGNRIAFGRTSNFGTGAGYSVALWSVYKDGTRLSFLTGPDLGTVNGKNQRASIIHDLRWLSPLSIAFETSSPTPSLWIHDLSLGNDFPRPLGLDIYFSGAHYCSQLRRYFFTRAIPGGNYTPSGLVSVSIDKADPKDYSLPVQVVFEQSGQEVFECSEDTVLYRDAQDQLILRKFNPDGTAADSGVKLGAPSDQRMDINFSPDHRYILVAIPAKNAPTTLLSIFKRDGTPIASQTINSSIASLRWETNQTLSLVTSSATNSQLYLAEVSDTSLKLTLVDSAASEKFIAISSR